MPCRFDFSAWFSQRPRPLAQSGVSQAITTPFNGNSITHLAEHPRAPLDSFTEQYLSMIITMTKRVPVGLGGVSHHPGSPASQIQLVIPQSQLRMSLDTRTAFLFACFNQQKLHYFQGRCFLSILSVSWTGDLLRLHCWTSLSISFLFLDMSDGQQERPF